MSDKIMPELLREIFENGVYLSSMREQARNSTAYRNTVLKEAKRLQKKQHREIVLLKQKLNVRS